MNLELSPVSRWVLRIWVNLPAIFCIALAVMAAFLPRRYWISVPFLLAIAILHFWIIRTAERRQPFDRNEARMLFEKALDSFKTGFQFAVIAIPFVILGRIDPAVKMFALGMVASSFIGVGWTRVMDEIGYWYLQKRSKSPNE